MDSFSSKISIPTGFFFISLWLTLVTNVSSQPGTFSVMSFGAKADGKTDDTQAFIGAWTQACAATTKSKVVVPAGTYFAVGPVVFKGPCKTPIELQLDGTVKAPPDMSGKDEWISFNYVNGLTVSGTGAFDGQGSLAWSQNQCSTKEKGGKCQFPINIRFNFITDGTITGISSVDSKFFHVNVLGCKNLKFQSFKVKAPGNSINTDGIHIGESTGVEILDTSIATGDDCVSIGPGTANLHVKGVTCGPGHGISIGSLGKYPNEQPVNGVIVESCTFTDTDTGVRIKTWPDGKSAGEAKNFTFADITVNNVKNPIVLDQEYCPYNACNKQVSSKIKISDVKFRNIHGTSTLKEAITLICSKSLPCEGVELTDIDLKYTGTDGAITSICNNLKPAVMKNVNPPTCTASAA